MIYKWIGAAFIVVSCGCVGLSMVVRHKREESYLRQLITTLDYMECELQYRLTPLPDLCRQAGQEGYGIVGSVFTRLGEELEAQIAPDVGSCMVKVRAQYGELPDSVSQVLLQLGQTLGRFDLPGQLKGLETVRTTCRHRLRELSENREPRLRSYQTLGLCAGAALAILLI